MRARDLVLLGTLSFMLRLAWVLVYGSVSVTQVDIGFFEFAAASLSRGGGYASPSLFFPEGEPSAGWPPGFSFVVSLAYRVFGVHLKLALALNVLLAVATVLLLYLIAERMLGRQAGRIAAGFFAVLPGPIFFTGLFMSETMFVFMLVAFLALVVFLPARQWTPVVLGVVLGLAALTRGEGLLMPVIPLAVWWGLPRRDWLRRTTVLLAVMALTILPWTIRNAVVMHEFIPVASNASWTLWSGHNSNANGGPTYPPPSQRINPGKGETLRARELRAEAVDWATHNPHKELGLIPRKLLWLNGGSSGSIDGWINARGQPELGRSSVIVFTVLGDGFGYFLLLVTLASLILIGARALWRAHPGMRGVLAYLALCLVNYGFVYYGQYRYRIPMEPFMILVATPLLTGVWAQRRLLLAGPTKTGGLRSPELSS